MCSSSSLSPESYVVVIIIDMHGGSLQEAPPTYARPFPALKDAAEQQTLVATNPLETEVPGDGKTDTASGPLLPAANASEHLGVARCLRSARANGAPRKSTFMTDPRTARCA